MPASPELIAALENADYHLLLLEPRSDFDECIVGVGNRFNDTFVVYDQACVMRILEAQSTDEEDPRMAALEHFTFNVIGSWVGSETPAFLITDPDEV